DVRTVEVAGVDMIDSARDRFAQHRDGAAAVLRRPEHTRSGELHGAVAQPLHDAIAKRERPGFADVDHDLSPVARRSRYIASMCTIIGLNRNGLFGSANN